MNDMRATNSSQSAHEHALTTGALDQPMKRSYVKPVFVILEDLSRATREKANPSPVEIDSQSCGS